MTNHWKHSRDSATPSLSLMMKANYDNSCLFQTHVRQNGKKPAYQLKQTKLLDQLCAVWGVDIHFKSSYYDAYKTVCGNHSATTTGIDDSSIPGNNMLQTVYKDIHCCTVQREFRMESTLLEQFERQPVPDSIQWFNTEGELHYFQLGHGTNAQEPSCQQKS